MVRPRPGPHKLNECIPLQILVRDVLKLVDTGSDAKRMIKMGEILVDGKPRKDHKYPAGLMDVVSIPKIKKNYRTYCMVNKSCSQRISVNFKKGEFQNLVQFFFK